MTSEAWDWSASRRGDDKKDAARLENLFGEVIANEEKAWRIANGEDLEEFEPRETSGFVNYIKPGEPLLRSPLPEPLINGQTFKPSVDLSKINLEYAHANLLLDAINKVESDIAELAKSYAAKKEVNDRTRDLIKQLNWLLDNARPERDRQEAEMRQITRLENVAKDDLRRLRDAYAEQIARQKERDSLTEQMELFAKLADERPWGEAAFKYQLDGAAQMVIEKRLILGDEMGLGKTLSAIMAADMSFSSRVLVITQNDIVTNFSREVDKWAPGRTVIPMGMYKSRDARHSMLATLQSLEQFVVLINYEMWRRDKRALDMLVDLKFDTVIIDEAHNLKSEKKGAFEGVNKIVYAENLTYICQKCEHEFTRWPYGDLCPSCFKPMDKPTFDTRCSVKRVYPMTGTTFLNEPGDAFPLLYLIDRIAFSDRRTFLDRYCYQEDVPSLTGSTVKKWVFRPGGQERLIAKLGTKYLRRTRIELEKEGIPLPPQDIQDHFIEFEEGEYLEQRKVIRNLYAMGQVILNEAKATGKIKVMGAEGVLPFLTRVRQALTYPAGMVEFDPETKEEIGRCPVKESIKIDYARKLTNELVKDNDQKVVLFSQFNAPLVRLKELLEEDGLRVGIYIGGVPQEQLDRITLQADAKYTKKEDMLYDVILANYKKGATGLNFTNYSQTVVLDREWNPGKQDQSYGRTNRIGQTEGTTVHVIEVKGSLDDGLRALNDRKRQMIEGFNSAAEEFNLVEYLERKLKEQ